MAYFSPSQNPRMVAPLHLTRALQSWRVHGGSAERCLTLSLHISLHRMARNANESTADGDDDNFIFSWKMFTSWDYLIGNPETADNKFASITTSFKVNLTVLYLLLETLPAPTNCRDVRGNLNIYSASLHMNRAWYWSVAVPDSMIHFL